MQAQPRDSFPVLDWIMSRHVHEYLDVGGRPVGEGRSAAFQDVQTEMRSCPYSGSRYLHAKPMNVTALQQMPPWPNVLTMLAWLSQRYRTAHGTEISDSTDLAQVTSAGVFLVDFLALRRRLPLRSREIPVLISGLYKVCLGFQLAYLPERFAEQATPTQLPDAAGFLAYLEESELLIGEAEVCSGSDAMIMQAYDAIVGGQAVPQGNLPPSCADLGIDWEQFDVFTDHAAGIWRDLVMFAIRMQEFLPELVDARLPAEVQERLNASLKQRGDDLLAGQNGLVVDLARAAQESVGCAAPALPPESPGAPEPSLLPEPGSLAATVVAWLNDVAPSDMYDHEPAVARALQARLSPYDVYEATVLGGLNQHLSCLMHALRLEAGTPLTASALSQVCGRTLRDWGASSW